MEIQKVNIIKCSPGPCYRQRLLCLLLKAFSLPYKKTGYNIGVYIRGARIRNERYINILVTDDGFSLFDVKPQAFTKWEFAFEEKEAKNIFDKYGDTPLQEKIATILFNFLLVERNRNLLQELFNLMSDFGIDV